MIDDAQLHSQWYAAIVKTVKEDNVRDKLKYRFCDAYKFYVPKRKLLERKSDIWRDVIHTLFPEYVLIKACNLNYTVDHTAISIL